MQKGLPQALSDNTEQDEVRAVPEAGFEVHVRDLPVVLREEPLLRSQRTYLREVTLKGRETPAGVGREFFERQILPEIRFHKGEEINLPGTAEIE